MKNLILSLTFIFIVNISFAGQRFDPSIDTSFHADPVPSVVGGLNLYNSMSNNMVNGYTGGLRYDYGMDFFILDLAYDSGLDPYGEFRFKFGPEFDKKVGNTNETEKEFLQRKIKEAVKAIDTMLPLIKQAHAINKTNKSGESKEIQAFITDRLNEYTRILKKVKDEFTYKNYISITFVKSPTLMDDAVHNEKGVTVLPAFGSVNATEYIVLPTNLANKTNFPDASDNFVFVRTLIHEATHSRESGLQTEDWGLDDGRKNKINKVDKKRGIWSLEYCGHKNGKAVEDIFRGKTANAVYGYFRSPARRWCAKYKKYPNE